MYYKYDRTCGFFFKFPLSYFLYVYCIRADWKNTTNLTNITFSVFVSCVTNSRSCATFTHNLCISREQIFPPTPPKKGFIIFIMVDNYARIFVIHRSARSLIPRITGVGGSELQRFLLRKSKFFVWIMNAHGFVTHFLISDKKILTYWCR